MTTTFIRPEDQPHDFEPGSGAPLDRRGRRIPKVEVYHEPQEGDGRQSRVAVLPERLKDPQGLTRVRDADGAYKRERVPEETDPPLSRAEKEKAAVKERFRKHENVLEQRRAVERRRALERTENAYRRDPVQASLDHGYNPIAAFDEEMERRDRY